MSREPTEYAESIEKPKCVRREERIDPPNGRTNPEGGKPGPLPGTRHAGSFRFGHDPRRNLTGPKPSPIRQDFQSKIREHTDLAINALVDCIGDVSAGWRERRAAAELVLNHGHGTPVSRVLMAQGETGGDARQLSTRKLLQRLSDTGEGLDFIDHEDE
tara:strand:- start:377 stop:853 length:477 start_codon:yes stop_codon:yes gene_type:complete